MLIIFFCCVSLVTYVFRYDIFVDIGSSRDIEKDNLEESSGKKQWTAACQQQLRAPFGEVVREYIENELRLQQSRWQLAIYECLATAAIEP